jgi:hypothetical protein
VTKKEDLEVEMDNKEAFEKKHEAKIEEMKAEIDRLKAKAKQSEADSQIKYEEKIETNQVNFIKH